MSNVLYKTKLSLLTQTVSKWRPVEVRIYKMKLSEVCKIRRLHYPYPNLKTESYIAPINQILKKIIRCRISLKIQRKWDQAQPPSPNHFEMVAS